MGLEVLGGGNREKEKKEKISLCESLGPFGAAALLLTSTTIMIYPSRARAPLTT